MSADFDSKQNLATRRNAEQELSLWILQQQKDNLERNIADQQISIQILIGHEKKCAKILILLLLEIT